MVPISLISLVVTTQPQLPATTTSSTSTPSTTTATTPPTSAHPDEDQESGPEVILGASSSSVSTNPSALLAAAQKLLVDHYHLDWTKPVLVAALVVGFQSLKNSRLLFPRPGTIIIIVTAILVLRRCLAVLQIISSM